MGVNAVAQGDIVSLSQLDALFARVYNLRNTHANSTHQLNASAIPAAQASSGLTVGSLVSATGSKIDILGVGWFSQLPVVSIKYCWNYRKND